MKKITIILMLCVSIVPAQKMNHIFRIGGTSSLLLENGNAYPVIGITAGFYPTNFFFIEGAGEYIFKSDYNELNIPITANLTYKSKYISPYAGAGVVYHLYDYSNYNEYSFGGRIKAGVTLFDTKGASGSFETTYDVPDFQGSKGRWYFTGRLDRSFNITF
ncbi:MAG TPA: hypothetical protein PKU94_01705 [Candidatus Hydrothermia bacterium]|nr:hypothetical protein [Candidatus Hydrothermia bacterium]HRD23273.1 hypothetical protein [Candidatus Hydrothermia bacterium]